MPVTFLGLLIYALAITRVTGFVVDDTLIDSQRDRFIKWLDDRPATLGSWIAKVVTCYWCAGMWVSIVAAPLIWWWGGSPWLLIPAFALAFSQVVGMTAHIGR